MPVNLTHGQPETVSSQRIEAGNSQHLRRVYGFRSEEVSDSANDRLGIFRPKDVFKRDVGSRHPCGADSEKYQLGRRSSAANRLAKRDTHLSRGNSSFRAERLNSTTCRLPAILKNPSMRTFPQAHWEAASGTSRINPPGSPTPLGVYNRSSDGQMVYPLYRYTRGRRLFSGQCF